MSSLLQWLSSKLTHLPGWDVFLNATQRKGFPNPVPQAVPLKGLVAPVCEDWATSGPPCKTTNLESELRASELRV